jgi:hypothetical protein
MTGNHFNPEKYAYQRMYSYNKMYSQSNAYIRTYHSRFIPEFSRDISNITPRHPHFTKIT